MSFHKHHKRKVSHLCVFFHARFVHWTERNNSLKWRIFCDKVRYLLMYTWLFSFTVLMVIIFRRCMSYLVSSRLPSSLHLRQESFSLIGVASGTVYSSVYVHLHVDYTHEVVHAL